MTTAKESTPPGTPVISENLTVRFKLGFLLLLLGGVVFVTSFYIEQRQLAADLAEVRADVREIKQFLFQHNNKTAYRPKTTEETP